MGVGLFEKTAVAAGESGAREGSESAAEARDDRVVDRDLNGAPLPYPMPEVVLRIREEVDWDSVLPARARTRRWRIEQRIKRGIDIVVSLAGLILLQDVRDAPAAYQYLVTALELGASPQTQVAVRRALQTIDALQKRSVGRPHTPRPW